MIPDADEVDKRATFVGRDWVLEAIADWLRDLTAPRFFLLTGQPGGGKTAIARQLDAISRGDAEWPSLTRGFLHAIHFCSAADGRSVDARSFIRSIAAQLANVNPDFRNAMVGSGDRPVSFRAEVHQSVGIAGTVTGVALDVNLSNLSAEAALSAALLEPLSAMRQTGIATAFVVLVDAVDEVTTSHGPAGPSIVDLLALCNGESAGDVRFIVTTRPVERVVAPLFNARRLSLASSDSQTLNKRDLLNYITSRAEREIAGRMPAGTQSMSAVATALAAKADGNFLYAKLLMDEFRAGTRDIEDLDAYPADIDHLYHDGLSRAVRAGGHAQDWRHEIAPIVATLVIAREPLAVLQLEALSGQRPSGIRDVLFRIEPFVAAHLSPVTGGSRGRANHHPSYSLFHESMREFLVRPVVRLDGADVANRFVLDLKECHSDVIERVRGSAKCWDDVDWSTVDDYALQYLPYHLRGAGRSAQLPDIMGRGFLSAKLGRLPAYAAIRQDLLDAIGEADRSRRLESLLYLAIVRAELSSRASEVDVDDLFLYAIAGKIDRAVDLVGSMPLRWERGVAMRGIVARLAPIDVDGAAAVADRSDVPEPRVECFVLVLKERLRRNSDLEAHRTILDGIMDVLQMSSNVSWKATILWELAVATMPYDASTGSRLLDEAATMARTDGDPQSRSERLSEVARSLFHHSPALAAQLFREALTALDELKVNDWVARRFGENVGWLAAVGFRSAQDVLAYSGPFDRYRAGQNAFCLAMGLTRASIAIARDRPVEAAQMAASARKMLRWVGLAKAEEKKWQRIVVDELASCGAVLRGGIASNQQPTEEPPRLVLLDPKPMPNLSEVDFRRAIETCLAGGTVAIDPEVCIRWSRSVGDDELAVRIAHSCARKSQTGQRESIGAARIALQTTLARAVGENSSRSSSVGGLADVVAQALELIRTNWREGVNPLASRSLVGNDHDTQIRVDALSEIIAIGTADEDASAVFSHLEQTLVARNAGMETAIQLAAALATKHPGLAAKILMLSAECQTVKSDLVARALADLILADEERTIKALEAVRARVRIAQGWFEEAMWDSAVSRLPAIMLPRSPTAAARVLDELPNGTVRHAIGTAHLAAAWGGTDFTAAIGLRDLSLVEARQMVYPYERIDAMIGVADAVVDWDPEWGLAVLNEALDLAHRDHEQNLFGEYLVRAAAIRRRLGHSAIADDLLVEATSSLARRSPDRFDLDAIVRAALQVSSETAARILGAIVFGMASVKNPVSSSQFIDWSAELMPIFVHAMDMPAGEAVPLLEQQIERALNTVEEVFLC